MLRNSTVALLLALTILCPFFSASQCIIAPAPENCTGTEPVVTDNSILAAGVKRWYYGPTTVFNQLTLQGGTLVVCTNLTIDRLKMDSGTIVVRPGAQLLIRSGVSGALIFEGNTTVYNYGTLQITCNLTLNGTYASAAKPNIIVNATTSSVFSLASQYFVINNPYSYFVNNGKSEFHGIITDNGGVAGNVCLGNGSETNMTILINKIRKSYSVPSGAACLQVRQSSQFFDTLTTSTGLNVCLGSGHTSDASCVPWGCKPNAWGPAQLFTNCTSCAAVQVLPFRFLAFTAQVTANGNRLWWQTASREEEYRFFTERSADGIHFSEVTEKNDRVTANGYECIDKTSGETIYYRVRAEQVTSGIVYFSNVVKVSQVNAGVAIYPNPFQNNVRISWQTGKKPVSVLVMNATGSIVFSKNIAGVSGTAILLQLPAVLAKGNYWLKITYSDGSSAIQRMCKI
ncbi:MAG: T9SS type A sorting domain-containing protein [Chitinophagaceae bacterium]